MSAVGIGITPDSPPVPTPQLHDPRRERPERNSM
jgi:hypothetical protein